MLKIFCLYHKRQIRNNYEKKTIDMDRFDRSDYGKSTLLKALELGV